MSIGETKELGKKVGHYDKHKTYDRAEEVWRENLKGPWDTAHRSQLRTTVLPLSQNYT